ncbi:MAG: hypothetical protein NVS3B7_20620 [Candidatus Elarobacter sp.]
MPGRRRAAPKAYPAAHRRRHAFPEGDIMRFSRFAGGLASAVLAVTLGGTPSAQTVTAAPVPAAPSAAPGTSGGPATAQTAAPIPAAAPVPAGPLALGARSLRTRRGEFGYELRGQALVKDACTAAGFARFFGNVFPPQFDVVQFRRPGMKAMLCTQRLTWVTILPLKVASEAPPRYITVRTRKGSVRVPLAGTTPAPE